MNLIKGGKPITPTEEDPTEHSVLLMSNGMDNGATVVDGEATKVEVSSDRFSKESVIISLNSI